MTTTCTDTEQVTLLTSIDWTLWDECQTVQLRFSKGAGSFVRQAAERFGLRASIQTIGIDHLFVTLTAC